MNTANLMIVVKCGGSCYAQKRVTPKQREKLSGKTDEQEFNFHGLLIFCLPLSQVNQTDLLLEFSVFFYFECDIVW